MRKCAFWSSAFKSLSFTHHYDSFKDYFCSTYKTCIHWTRHLKAWPTSFYWTACRLVLNCVFFFTGQLCLDNAKGQFVIPEIQAEWERWVELNMTNMFDSQPILENMEARLVLHCFSQHCWLIKDSHCKHKLSYFLAELFVPFYKI